MLFKKLKQFFKTTFVLDFELLSNFKLPVYYPVFPVSGLINYYKKFKLLLDIKIFLTNLFTDKYAIFSVLEKAWRPGSELTVAARKKIGGQREAWRNSTRITTATFSTGPTINPADIRASSVALTWGGTVTTGWTTKDAITITSASAK